MPERSNITFHVAGLNDIPLIQDLSSRIWRQHYHGIISHEQIDYMLGKMYATDVIQDEIERQGYVYLLAFRDGDPVGFAASCFETGIGSIKVSKIYLLPSLHGLGIGRMMLQRVKDDAIGRGAGTIYLFVNKRNAKAIRAYERFGFVKTAEVVTDIGGGFVMDDYRMELPL